MILGDPTEVGTLIKRKRAELGFTQKQLAEVLGISPIAVMRLELGRVGYVHAHTAKALEGLEIRLQLLKNQVQPKRMALVPAPDPTLEERLKALMPEQKTITTGDAGATTPVAIAPRPSAPKRLYTAHKAKPMPPSRVPTVKRALLWLAAKI